MRALLRAVSLLLVGAGVAYGASIVWNSSQLELRRVEVAGNDQVLASEIAAAPELKRGDHLLRISTRSVERAVEAIPWVRTARAERIIPSTIRITVVERTARVVVVAPNGPYLVDGEGVVLEPSDGSSNLVRVDELPVGELDAGDRIEQSVLDQSISILDALDAALRADVVSVNAPAVDRITLNMQGGWEIVYGAFEQAEEKGFAIDALIEQAREEGIQIARIDVRVPSRPALRPR